MNSNKRILVAMGAVAVIAIAFWMLLLSPKRDEAKKLDQEIVKQQESLSVHRSEVEQGLQASRDFPRAYQQLVVLGKAAPADADTPSLLVQLNTIAHHSHVRFQGFSLAAADAGEPAEEGEAPSAEAEPVSPTEVAASTMPLGASIGPAGLAVMPYGLTFKGSFFHLADFIHGLDSLVETNNSEVSVTGRLITINSFNLSADANRGFPFLEASFSVTTFLVPPAQGVTAGASPTSPAPSTANVATTIGGTP